MSAERRCRCCGICVDGLGEIRARLRVCIGCDDCDALHGDMLQGVLIKAVADGKINPYVAIARSLIDDAQLTGRTIYRAKPDNTADIEIPNPPPRWMVVCGRALARGQQPDLHSVVGAVLERYFGRSSSVLGELRAELRDALAFVDPSIFDVEVSTKLDTLDPGHLMIEIKAKTPTLAVTTPGADELIPADIMSRKRAEA